MTFAPDNSHSIGRTPLVRINRLVKGSQATVLAKIEGRNPAYSVKCRIGASMIWQAEKDGKLKPGGEIIEPTSGNTGIALAFVAAARGYRLTVTMPESMSLERRKVLTLLGARVVLTPADKGMKGAVAKAEQLVAENPAAFMPQQFKNPANPEIHFKTTGPEIWEDTEGKIDVLVSGVGTGGTITGVSRYIKQAKRQADPERRGGTGGKPGDHPEAGGPGVEAGTAQDSGDRGRLHSRHPGPLRGGSRGAGQQRHRHRRRPTARREEGIMSGISCGAAAAVAIRLAQDPAFAGKTIVVVLPDSGERYLSGALCEGLFNESDWPLRSADTVDRVTSWLGRHGKAFVRRRT